MQKTITFNLTLPRFIYLFFIAFSTSIGSVIAQEGSKELIPSPAKGSSSPHALQQGKKESKDRPYGYERAKESKEKRDMYSKHYRNDDGSFTAVISSGPVHYEENGRLYDIDANITANADGKFSSYAYANTTNLMKSYFSGHSSGGLLSVTKEGAVKEFINTRMYWEKNGMPMNILNSSDVKALVKGEQITYRNLYPLVDAQYSIVAAKRKLNYIIHNKSFLNKMPAGINYLVFAEDIQIEDDWTYEVTQKGIYLKDASGTNIYRYQNPYVGEGMGTRNERSFEDHDNPSSYSVSRNGNVITILIKVQVGWLTDASRIFPLNIDPTVNVSPNATVDWTGRAYSDATGADDALRIGKFSNNAWITGFSRFNLSTIPTGNTVSSATFNMTAFTASPTAPTTAHLYAITNCMDPLSASTYSDIYNSINTAYSANVGNLNATGLKTITLNANGIAAIQSGLSNFVAMAAYPQGTWPTTRYRDVRGYSNAARPYLAVTYAPSCTPVAPTLTATANGGSGTQYNVINTTVSLSQTTTDGTNCGAWTYAWSNNGGAANSFWNGTNFTGAAASYSAGYSTISPTIAANTTYTCYVQGTGSSSALASSTVTVNVVTLPTITAQADGTPVSITVANNVSVALTANPTGGSGCTGTTEFAWSNDGGTTYWNGSAFSGGANWSASYENISTTITATKTFRCYVRCSSATNATANSNVTVNLGSCAAPTLAAEANGGTGTVIVGPASTVNLSGNHSGGNYCDGNGAWDYAWSNDGGTTFWNGTAFSGGAVYDASYENISFTAGASGTTTYNVYARCANNTGCASTTNSVIVDITVACAAPTLVANADGTTGETIPNNSTVVLEANPGGGANCSGAFVFAWRNGTGGNDYWNGSSFTGDNTNYSASYDSISVANVTVGRTFQALVKCDADAACNGTSSVTVSIGSCSAPAVTARANGNTGTVTVPTGDGVTLTANPVGGSYCDGYNEFQYAWSYDASHWWNGTDFSSPTANWSSAYNNINPTNITANYTFTAYVQCAANSSCTGNNSVNVQAGACSAPSLTARGNGTATSITVASGSTVALTANPAGGTNCAGGGIFEYAWFDGSGYWNGTGFSSATPVFATGYGSISATNILASKNYTVYSRCQGNVSCTSSSAVLVYIIATVFTENFNSSPTGWTAGAFTSSIYDSWTISSSTGGNANYTVDNTANLQITCSGCSPTNNNYSLTTFDIYIYKYIPVSSTDLTLGFQWLAKGENDGTIWDYGQVGYSLNGTSFTWLGVTSGSTDHGYNNQGKYCNLTGQNGYPAKTASIPLPSALNNTPFYLAFRFISDANTGFRPPFIVDNIVITAAQPLGTAISSVSLLNSGGAQQICFNNSHINTNAPIFRVSATSSGNFDSYQVEVNTNSTFTGTSYVQTYSGGTYANNTAYNLTFNSPSPSFSPTNGAVYYARVRASGNAGTTWSAWTSVQHSFVYDAAVTAVEWYQDYQKQFMDAGYAAASLEANASNNLEFSSFTGGSNPFSDPTIETGAGWSTKASYSVYTTSLTTNDNGTNGITTGTHCIKYSEDDYSWQGFVANEYNNASQQVDLTGVTNLQFDITHWRNTQSNMYECGIGRACKVVWSFKVIVGNPGTNNDNSGTEVYTWTPTTAEFGVTNNYNVNVDLSAYGFTGTKTVKFSRVVTNGGGVWYDDDKYYLDNIRTSSTAPTSGTFTSAPAYLASINGALNWSTLKWNQTLNGGTITFKLQKYETGSWSDISGLTNLSAAGDGDKSVSIATSTDAQVRIVMTMTQSGTSPALNNWALTATSCTAPTVTAQANGTPTSTTVAAGASISLTANASGGTNCSDYFEYAWSDGSNYWNGSSFGSGSATYDASYSTIAFTASATKTYSLTVRCHASTNCLNNSQVVVNVATVPANISAVIGSPANGTQHHLQVSWAAAPGATTYGLEYSTNGSSWTAIGDVSGVTYDYNAGDSPNAPYYFRVRSKINSVYSGYIEMTTPTYTACDYPALPTLGTPGGTTLPVSITTETPVANPAITTYAIFCTTNSLYVQASGALGATEVYQTAAQWSTTTIIGLSNLTQYCFYAKAKNNDGDIRYQAPTAILAAETFSSDVISNASSPSTSTFGSPNTCGAGSWFDYNATAGCSGGGGAKYTATSDNFFTGCYLRTPIVNCTGMTSVTLSFDLTNHQDAGDNFDFSCWSVGDNAYNGDLVTVNGVSASNITFSTARNCTHIDAVFSLSGITNKSQLMFYINNNGDNDFGSYNLVIDNFGINTPVATACATTTNASCTAPPAPIVTVVNNCGSSTLSTTSTGSLLWSTGATTSAITVTSAATYSVTASESTCTSTAGVGTSAPLTIPAAPTGSPEQSFCNGATVADLVAAGSGIQWYAASSGGSALATSTPLVNGTHYYATQTSGSCESTNRLNVTATVTTCNTTYTVKFFIQGYYLGGGKMSPLLKLLNPAASPTDVDTATVELRTAADPATVAYSYKGVLKNDGNLICSFNGTVSGNYYIVIRHRNSLDTWSASVASINAGGNYNFTTGSGQAYNASMVNLGNEVYGIYSGDINGDGSVNGSDKASLQLSLPSFIFGSYNLKDITGDGFVDEDDLRILKNNAPLNLSSQHP